jgi:N-acetylglucosamine kinase-like BadF-type ATPase
MVERIRETLVLGVDAGGSKTRAMLAKLDLRRARDPSEWRDSLELLGQGESGPGNPRSVGFETVYENIQTACDEAFRCASRLRSKVDSVCICMAGVGRADQREPVAQWCEQVALANRIRISEDVSPIRWAALWETRHVIEVQSRLAPMPMTAGDWNNSVTLIAGTGSIVSATKDSQAGDWELIRESSSSVEGAAIYGLHEPELTSVRVGGWGYILGDEGSGYAIGLAALKEVCRAHDSGEQLSALHQVLLKELGCESPIELIPIIYTQPIPRPKIASLYRHVVRHSASDLVAAKLLEYAASDLAELIASGASRAGLSARGYRLALSGGTLLEKSPLVPAILRHLDELGMTPMMSHQVADPVLGAVVMASLPWDSSQGASRLD